MIDPENQVFSTVYDAVIASYPDTSISSEYVRSPPSLPHISIVMTDNYVVKRKQTADDSESNTNFTFEVNVYSNKQTGKKSECKELLQVVDKVLYSLNIQRISLTPVPNLEDATIYRLVARYTGSTDGTYFHRS